MITSIKINGFKAFHQFEMEFAPFTIIAGLNASGKSNLFDALMLLSSVATSDNLKKSFKEQRGEFLELFTQYGENSYADTMSFCVEMLVGKTVKDAWGNTATLKYTRLRYELTIRRITNQSGIEDLIITSEHLENLKHDEDTWIRKMLPKNYMTDWRPKVDTGKRGLPYLFTEKQAEIDTVVAPQDGTTGRKRRFPLTNSTRTVLSSFDTVDFPHILAAKEEMKSWKFLQMNPDELRQPTSKSTGDDVILPNGRNLAAALYRIKQTDSYLLKEITRTLQRFLPNFVGVDVIDDKENKQYLIKLKDKHQREYTSRVLSEGTLRILALCIMQFDDKHTGLLCFEEPENGVHPSRIKDMLALLKDLTVNFEDIHSPLRQVIINTHSSTLVSNLTDTHKDTVLWLAQMKNQIITLYNPDKERVEVLTTVMLPVDKTMQLTISEQDKKWTLHAVQEYLHKENNLQ